MSRNGDGSVSNISVGLIFIHVPPSSVTSVRPISVPFQMCQEASAWARGRSPERAETSSSPAPSIGTCTPRCHGDAWSTRRMLVPVAPRWAGRSAWRWSSPTLCSSWCTTWPPRTPESTDAPPTIWSRDRRLTWTRRCWSEVSVVTMLWLVVLFLSMCFMSE